MRLDVIVSIGSSTHPHRATATAAAAAGGEDRVGDSAVHRESQGMPGAGGVSRDRGYGERG